jgi:predicted dehydrogenase
MKAEKRSGKVLSIGFQPRLDANMQMVKDVVQSGVLGEIYYVQTGGGRRRGIPTPFGTTFIEDATAGLGALADIGCYSLDMVMNAIGHPKPLTASGMISDRFGKDPNYCGYAPEYAKHHSEIFGVDDFAAAFIRLEGDIIIDFRISWAMNIDSPGDTIILGTKGGLRIPATECWNGTVGGDMTIYKEVGGLQTEIKVPMDRNKCDRVGLKVGSFVEAVKNGGTSPVPTSQIIYNQAIIDAIAKSAECGREVKIEIPEI